jgi:hypothetical protein
MCFVHALERLFQAIGHARGKPAMPPDMELLLGERTAGNKSSTLRPAKLLK